MARKIGQLTVDLRLVSQKFQAGLNKANASLKVFRSTAQKATRVMGGMNAGIAGLVGAAGLGMVISKSLKSADAIGKMSDRLNVSTESLSAFNQLVQLNGGEITQFEKAITRMARSIGEAERGFGTGKKSLDDLGISLDMLTGKSADEQFLIISEAISKVGSASQQASLASDIFGRSGVDLLNTIVTGRDGFESARKEVELYGLSLSRIDAAKVEAANDSILRAQQVMKGAAMTAAVQLSPYLEAVADEFVKMGTEGEGFKGIFKSVVESTVVGVSYITNAFNGISIIINTVKMAIFGLVKAKMQAFDFIVNQVLIPFANKASSLLIDPIKNSLQFLSKYSDTAKEMLAGIGDMQIGKTDVYKMAAFEMEQAFLESKSNIYDALSGIIPIDEVRSNLDELFEAAEKRAAETVKTIQDRASVTFDDFIPPKPKEDEENVVEDKTKEYEILYSKESSFQEKMAALKVTSSKKVAAIQKAMALKDAIVNGFSAMQKAVASAPFPLNVPAIAFTGAQVAANIAGIKGQAHSGIDYVPREGTWLLDKGERVVDSRTNADLKGFLSGGQAQQTSVNYAPVINGSGLSESQLTKVLSKNNKRFVRAVNAAIGVPA